MWLSCLQEEGWCPLHLAAGLGMISVVRELADSGADLEAHDHDGDRALHMACSAGKDDVVEYETAWQHL